MNGEQLVAEVMDIVQDGSVDADAVLALLNQGQIAVASRVLLPGLSDGNSTVTTLTDGYLVDLPVDYHRELFLAQVDGRKVPVYANKMLLMEELGLSGIGLSTGTIYGVTTNGKQLLYQMVPVAAKDIELFYYRLPAAIAETTASYPDGLTTHGATNDHFDWALIHYAASHLFSKIEDGMEGQKVNTQHHAGMFEGRVAEIESATGRGRPRPAPPICGVNW